MTRMQALALAAAVAAGCEKDPPTTEAPEDASVGDDAPAENEPTQDEPTENEPGPKAPDPVQFVLEIDGRVTKAQIDALVQEHLNEIRACYDDALTNPEGIELKGAIVVSFTATKTGTVTSAAVEQSEFGHKPTETCLVGVVEGFKLPKQKSDSKVKLPFYMNVL